MRWIPQRFSDFTGEGESIARNCRKFIPWSMKCSGRQKWFRPCLEKDGERWNLCRLYILLRTKIACISRIANGSGCLHAFVRSRLSCYMHGRISKTDGNRDKGPHLCVTKAIGQVWLWMPQLRIVQYFPCVWAISRNAENESHRNKPKEKRNWIGLIL